MRSYVHNKFISVKYNKFLNVKAFYGIPTLLPFEMYILMLSAENRHPDMLCCSYAILGRADLHTKISITQMLSIWHLGTSLITLCVS